MQMKREGEKNEAGLQLASLWVTANLCYSGLITRVMQLNSTRWHAITHTNIAKDAKLIENLTFFFALNLKPNNQWKLS